MAEASAQNLGLSHDEIYAEYGLSIKTEPIVDDTSEEPGNLFEPANTCSDLLQPAQTCEDLHGLYEDLQIKEEVVIVPVVLPALSCRDETKKSRSSEKSSLVVETRFRRFTKNKNEKNNQENNGTNNINMKDDLKVHKIKIKNKKRDNKNDKNKHKEDCNKNKELLTCKTCHKVFTMSHNLQRHINQFHGDHLIFSCDKCNKTFTRRDYLAGHRQIHDLGGKKKSKSKSYQCDKCNKTVNGLSNFRRHQQIYCVANFCPNSKYICDCCQKGFRDKEALENHLRFKMASFRRLFCDCCDKSFTRKYDLEKHIMKNMGLNADTAGFICDSCNTIFSTRYTLKRHHQRSSSVQCKTTCKSRQECHRNKNRCQVHKRFVCDFCDKGFARKYNMEQHIMKRLCLHDGTAGFICDICNKIFGTRYTMNRHRIQVHCKKSCKSRQECHRNKNRCQVHRRYVCDFCDKGFARKYRLKQHIMIHMGLYAGFICDICNKIFSSRYALKKHRILVQCSAK